MHDVYGGLSLVHRVCYKIICCQSKTNAIADTNLYNLCHDDELTMCVDLLCSHVERRIMPFLAS